MDIYFIIVLVLLALAAFDLVVGVSNDAVNFLNSAIGSKAAPRFVIMIVASLGIMIGAIFSSGMMEVARSGIFNPAMFTFEQVMVIFLAVMITDVLLIDFFNTLGMPTSTTVSLVFDLLGASVVVSLLSIVSQDGDISAISEYINTAKVLTIISAIFISVAIAFSVGTIVQFFARLLFSFNYKNSYRYYGAIWGGFSITAIIYFIIMKGLKGTTLSSDTLISYIDANTGLILFSSFVVITLILQLIIMFTRINILKGVVLIGTFALALAFAGNDLVNFIGVSVAGLDSYDIFKNSGSDASMMMNSLKGAVHTSPLLLIGSGVIMAATLWFSKKAKTVTETEISLANQNAVVERFGSTQMSRGIVRSTRNLGNNISAFLPTSVNSFIERRFRKSTYAVGMQNQASFDLIRASVNLVMSSILIASATSLKLPLSTTYVTFMVAMGTSLSDKAWGRESAVYRVTGVLTVIGGWFITAIIAFVLSGIIAGVCYLGGFWGMGAMVVMTVLLILHSNRLHNKRVKKNKTCVFEGEVKEETIMEKCVGNIKEAIVTIKDIYSQTIIGLNTEDRKLLKSLDERMYKFTDDTKMIKQQVYITLNQFSEETIHTGHYYVQVIDYLREIAHSLSFITKPSFEHINNQHQGLSDVQVGELEKINFATSEFFEMNLDAINRNDFSMVPRVIEKQQEILFLLNEARKNEVRRIKSQAESTRNAILYLAILNETKNLMLQTLNLLKAQRDFITEI
ncbi:MAG: inorganic phosphate transporter [Bacteroidetes bacterium]|nr:inorganic phosphate transporter [Bacteroidota bacterium]